MITDGNLKRTLIKVLIIEKEKKKGRTEINTKFKKKILLRKRQNFWGLKRWHTYGKTLPFRHSFVTCNNALWVKILLFRSLLIVSHITQLISPGFREWDNTIYNRYMINAYKKKFICIYHKWTNELIDSW